MARARRRKRSRKRAKRAKRAGPPRRAPNPTAAETGLLRLAGEITPLAAADALRALAAAYSPAGTLPRAIAQAWLRSRGDKTATLALAFARENVRLALEEVLARAPRGALPGSPATRAWLVLAACEALAQEPREAAADRLRTLLELSGHAAGA